ncbi:hypothetical protein THAOC_12195 [Thalassiosira oceanica]|uniref:Uncharacterized protein n=1 Tax=Thalassiosira oceanica TaxID=159749 RepID=K0T0M1_THAOC|nr:hypothetical protein THAOC_12195 [Thalassiosira oceanica]|eukprot:EJK66841.1 hypothetical protein THAOC_12195 [Thalassiosira oceanica]
MKARQGRRGEPTLSDFPPPFGIAPAGEANCSSATSLNHTAVGNIKSRRMDDSISAAASSGLQIQSRTGEANRQRCRRGAAEDPDIDIGPEGGVDGPR